MLQDDIPCVLVARAGWLGTMPCILLGSSSPQQPGPTAELSLPKAPSPVTATHEVCITLMMFKIPSPWQP